MKKYIFFSTLLLKLFLTNITYLNAQIKTSNNINLNSDLLTKITGQYVYLDDITSNDFINFKGHLIIMTLEFDKINRIFKSTIKRQIRQRETLAGPFVNYTIDGSQSNGRYNLNIKDTTINFNWLKKQKLDLSKARIETDFSNGDTLLVFSDSIKFKRTHKIENGFFVEVVEKLIVDYFEILKRSFNRRNYTDAKNFVNTLGDNWRLPTKYELKKIYENKNMLLSNLISDIKINNNYSYFWSSSDVVNEQMGIALDFNDGVQFETYKNNKLNILAVRTIKEKSKEYIEHEKNIEEDERKKSLEAQRLEKERERKLREKKINDSLEKEKREILNKSIIGQPLEFNGLFIAEFNFPKLMNLKTAVESCESLGPGWRLPSYNELFPILRDPKLKNVIPKFPDGDYWISDGYKMYIINNYPSTVWMGCLECDYTFKVRAVKTKE